MSEDLRVGNRDIPSGVITMVVPEAEAAATTVLGASTELLSPAKKPKLTEVKGPTGKGPP